MEEMRYLEHDNMWLLQPPKGHDLEVLIAGSRDAPDAARSAVLDRVLPMIDTLHFQAEEYLGSFLDRTKFSSPEQWHLEGIEFGRNPSTPIDQFTMYFSIGDDLYGEWSVCFQLSNVRFFAVFFGRRQI